MGLYDLFRDPPSAYRQTPFWFWNHRITQDDLSWQIEQMHEKGLGGFVVHARHGLLSPSYRSDAWNDCIRFCCEKADSLEINAWLQDTKDSEDDAAICNPENHLSPIRLDMVHASGDVHTARGIVPKLVSSAALLAGRERVTSETFGASGWGLSLRGMKRMADWQLALGINAFVPHAFHYSIAGHRKKDSPPSAFYQSPFWPYYRAFADYTARITAAMTGGSPVAKVAVLYPDLPVWSSFVPADSAPALAEKMEEALAPACKMLLELHRDFLVLDEDAFASAKLEENGFTINGLRFDALVIPKDTSLQTDALDALRRVAASCTAVAVGVDAIGDVNLSEMPGVSCIPPDDRAALADALAGITPDVTLKDAPEVYYLHRKKDGLDLFFFANTGTGTVTTTASFEAVGRAELWNAQTGERCSAPGQHVVAGRLAVPLTFAAGTSHLIVIHPEEPVAEIPEIEFHPEREFAVCDLWEFAPESGNRLILRQWNMTVKTQREVTELRYDTSFLLTESIANMRLILDGVPDAPEADAIILLNGEPVADEIPWETDLGFRVLSLGTRCPAGSYRIEIVLNHHGKFTQPALQEYVWLAGDFAIEMEGGMPRLTPIRGLKAGPWEQQGFPHFSGTGAYGAECELPDDIEGKRVFLNAGRVGDLLEVEVNGRVMEVCPWPPYRTEISDAVRPGLNTIFLKVTNTAINMIEGPDGDHPSGLLDVVRLEIGE